MSKVKIEIDGITTEVDKDTKVIEAADSIGIDIPRFCYHPQLSIAANCRMCLVEVENCPKPLPACATPVTDGMVIKTKSKLALNAQKSVMEFLLINHPLDCPVCDQGGECELQDVAMGYGSDISNFSEAKRVVEDKDIGPLIATEMTRCIHCTRCVRFGEEIAGLKEFGATGRGEEMQIGTFLSKSVDSELSGNVIDLCPVGALTSKPFRYSARTWELSQHKTVSPHDCYGSNVYMHVLHNEVKRAVPCRNEEINEVWLSDRDRFSYTGINAADRLLKPMLKEKGKLVDCDWKKAFEYTANNLNEVLAKRGNSSLGALVSPSATTEEFYLLQKLVRALGSNNIDHRLRQIDNADDYCNVSAPNLGIKLNELEDRNIILLIGSDLHNEVPLLATRLRKAALNGTKIIVINDRQINYNFPIYHNLVIENGDILSGVSLLLKAVLDVKKEINLPSVITAKLSELKTTKEFNEVAKLLATESSISIISGLLASKAPDSASMRAMIKILAETISATKGELSYGANSAGGHLAGAIPVDDTFSEVGLSYTKMLLKELKCYILFNIDPLLDTAWPLDTIRALQHADFVIAFSSYKSKALLEVADVILPIGTYAESSGTYVNAQGAWQCFNAAIKTMGESRPAWKVLRVLANFLKLDNFEYNSSGEVLLELQKKLINTEAQEYDYMPEKSSSNMQDGHLFSLPCVPLYNSDDIVRRANALQETKRAKTNKAAVYLSQETALKHKLSLELPVLVLIQGHEVTLPLAIDDNLGLDRVCIPGGNYITAQVEKAYTTVQLRQE